MRPAARPGFAIDSVASGVIGNRSPFADRGFYLRPLVPCGAMDVTASLANLRLAELVDFPEELALIKSQTGTPTFGNLDAAICGIGGIDPANIAAVVASDHNRTLVRNFVEVFSLLLFSNYQGDALLSRIHATHGKLATYLGRNYDSNRWWPCFHFRAARDWAQGQTNRPIVNYYD